MRTFTASLLALAFFATPALAAPAALTPATFSPEFQEKLHDDLGEREGPVLQEMVARALTRALATSNANVTVETTIVNARANRPTFEQLSANTSLSYGLSRGNGGAELIGIVRGADGRELARVEHEYFETDLRNASLDDWGDARRAFYGYARKVARAVAAIDG